MTAIKNYWQKIQLIAILVIICVSNITHSPTIWAQLVTPSNPIQFKPPPPPPPDRSAAGERGDAASRGCGNGEQSLMALAPYYEQTINVGEEKIPITKVWGLTTAEYPTFWFSIPYEKSSITKVEFVVKDESQKPSKTIYRTTLIEPEVPGIVGISIGKTAEPLQVSKTRHEKMYHWYFKVRVECNRTASRITNG